MRDHWWWYELLSSDKPSLWQRGVGGLLWGASLAYGVGVRVRNLLYDWGILSSFLSPVPVISVGNLTVGGSGKTPMVEFLCRGLVERGERVVILSRGYGASRGSELNDEGLLLRENLPHVPHLQGRDRVQRLQEGLERFSPTVFVLDDGFQHRRLARQWDLLLIDSLQPFGFGHLLPRGLLREPLSSLARCDAICLTRANQVSPERLAQIEREVRRYSEAPLFYASFLPRAVEELSSGQMVEWEELRHRPLVAFGGIGNPRSFWKLLESIGISPVATYAFPDHHNYSEEDLAFLEKLRTQKQGVGWVTTQKDKTKLLAFRELLKAPCYVLHIGAEVEPEEVFWEHLTSRLQREEASPKGISSGGGPSGTR